MSVDMLGEARRLVDTAVGPEGVWPRAAAFLARQTLEDAVVRMWERNVGIHDNPSMNTRLVCLDLATRDLDLSADVRSAYATLSRACHHHPYELAPTATELDVWIGQVERLVEALEGTAAPS